MDPLTQPLHTPTQQVAGSSSKPPEKKWGEAELEKTGKERFIQDIETNLTQLERSVSSKENFNHEVVFILKRDLSFLKKEFVDLEERINLLWNRLETVEMQSGTARIDRDKEDVQISLVGELGLPSTLHSEDSGVQKGLQILSDKGYFARRVGGTGHCLFSSIAAHLVTEQRLNYLLGLLPALRDKGLLRGGPDPEVFIRACLGRLGKGESVEQLLQDPAMYKNWVMFLRILATNSLRQQIMENSDLKTSVANEARETIKELKSNDSDDEVCEIYLQHMASMMGSDGGSTESQGLESVLRISIRMIDAKNLGELQQAGQVEGQLKYVGDCSHICLVQHDNHFDPLYPPSVRP